MTVAALFVEAGGVYAQQPGIDLWDRARDARLYQGPHRVIAHPPCERWGRWWWRLPGGLRAERPGEDGGCFEAAVGAVRAWGGVLEHPAGSLAWPRFGLPSPPSAGWGRVMMGGWVCEVYQGHYAHRAPKPSWLFWRGEGEPPPLRWGRVPGMQGVIMRGQRRQSPTTLMCGRERRATPAAFAEVLIMLAKWGRDDDD